MKVAILTPPVYSVPPEGYGGEIFCWDLICGLAELGVEVHLFARSKSQVPKNGYLHYIPELPLEYFVVGERVPWHFYEDILKEMDVLHSFQHSGYVHNSVHFYWKGNSLHTCWGTMLPAYIVKTNVVSWSKFHRECMLQQGAPKSTRYVYGGTNTDFYCPSNYEKDNYFLFLSRWHPTKRPEVVLALAKRFPDITFVFGSKPGTPDHVYYGAKYLEVANKLPNVKHVEPTHEEKRELYRRARAVIFPSIGEAFGLVAVEALGCGTPLICSNDGAFREIVLPGETGFLCDNLDDFEKAIRKIGALEPKRCREDAEKRWNRLRVAKDYLKVYKDIANGEYF